MNTVRQLENDDRLNPGFPPISFDINKLLNKAQDAELAKEQGELLSEVYSLQSRYLKLMERCNQDNVAYLEAQRDLAVERCRAASDAYDTCVGQQARLQDRRRELAKASNAASFAVLKKKESPLDPSFATKKDIKKWNDELAELELKFQAVVSQAETQEAIEGSWRMECQRLQQALDNAKAAEFQLRSRIESLTGKSDAEQLGRKRSGAGLSGIGL